MPPAWPVGDGDELPLRTSERRLWAGDAPPDRPAGLGAAPSVLGDPADPATARPRSCICAIVGVDSSSSEEASFTTASWLPLAVRPPRRHAADRAASLPPSAGPDASDGTAASRSSCSLAASRARLASSCSLAASRARLASSCSLAASRARLASSCSLAASRACLSASSCSAASRARLASSSCSAASRARLAASSCSAASRACLSASSCSAASRARLASSSARAAALRCAASRAGATARGASPARRCMGGPGAGAAPSRGMASAARGSDRGDRRWGLGLVPARPRCFPGERSADSVRPLRPRSVADADDATFTSAGACARGGSEGLATVGDAVAPCRERLLPSEDAVEDDAGPVSRRCRSMAARARDGRSMRPAICASCRVTPPSASVTSSSPRTLLRTDSSALV